MSPDHHMEITFMYYSTRTSTRADHCRLQAAAARHRGAQAPDQSAKTTFEEVAIYWGALAEQIESLERNRRASFTGKGWLGGRILLSLAAFGLIGFAVLVVIGLWSRYSLETEALGFSGIYERLLASQVGLGNDPQAYHSASETVRAWQAADSHQAATIEE
jgi:hypothetical protein